MWRGAVGLLLVCLTSVLDGAEGQPGTLPEPFRAEDLLWEMVLGTHQYTIPRIDGGQVFLGIDDAGLEHPGAKRTGGGTVLCLDQATGRVVWRLPVPRYMQGTKAPFHFDHWKCGVCSRPALDDKRLYLVGSRGDVLCLDRAGQADGNAPPFTQEADYMGIAPQAGYAPTPGDGDIVWRFDMIQELGVVPHDVCGSSPLLHGDHVYACTSNGVDDTHKKVANPLAPSLIVLDKNTGRLAATDGERIGQRMLHGHWSSPVAAEAGGRTLILFGGGDGVLYAFEPPGGAGSSQPQTLKKIWQYDCNPPDYREKDGQPIPYASWNRNSPEGPSEIIATPVLDRGRIYVAIGQSPIHGPGQGLFSCIDTATGRKIWDSRLVGRSLSDAAVDGGLVYVSDYSGRLHCFDAETGQRCWEHALEGGVWCASPVVVAGKVYISTEKNLLWVLKAGREKQVLSRSRLPTTAITPAVHDGVFYFPTQKRLYALRLRS